MIFPSNQQLEKREMVIIIKKKSWFPKKKKAYLPSWKTKIHSQISISFIGLSLPFIGYEIDHYKLQWYCSIQSFPLKCLSLQTSVPLHVRGREKKKTKPKKTEIRLLKRVSEEKDKVFCFLLLQILPLFSPPLNQILLSEYLSLCSIFLSSLFSPLDLVKTLDLFSKRVSKNE